MPIKKVYTQSKCLSNQNRPSANINLWFKRWFRLEFCLGGDAQIAKEIPGALRAPGQFLKDCAFMMSSKSQNSLGALRAPGHSHKESGRMREFLAPDRPTSQRKPSTLYLVLKSPVYWITPFTIDSERSKHVFSVNMVFPVHWFFMYRFSQWMEFQSWISPVANCWVQLPIRGSAVHQPGKSKRDFSINCVFPVHGFSIQWFF